MAGRKLVNATYNVSIDWQDECSSKNILKKGYFNIEFSEMGTTTIPIIQAGSSIDIDGVIYVFDTNENITGSIASGVNYVKVYDSSGTAVAEFTQVAPSTYDYLKGGYYNGVERYVMIFSSTGSDYSDKRIMNKGEALYLENDITVNDIDIKGSVINDLDIDGIITKGLGTGPVVTDSIKDLNVTLAKLANASISQSKLKTSIGSVSGGTGNYTLPGGTYGFYPQIKTSSASYPLDTKISDNTTNTAYATRIHFAIGAGAGYAQQRYVTSSGEVYWYFILRNIQTKEIIAKYQAPDHPCFGNDISVENPFPDFDTETGVLKLNDKEIKAEIIVVNPKLEQAKEIYIEAKKQNKDMLEIIKEEYVIEDIKSPEQPDKNGEPDYYKVPITVGLDYNDTFPFQDDNAKSIKRIIEKPNYIKIKKLMRNK